MYDNAKGFSNESAPGADRFKLSVVLHRKLITDTNDSDFVELLRVENGVIKEIVTKTEYNIFADELARRTYDESGDYYIKPFSIDVRESLNDRIGNRGIYFDTQQTQNGNAPADDIISLQVSSGKAYVRGYEVDKISTSSIDVLKPRTTKLVENQSVPIRMGKSVEITNVVGSPEIDFSNNTTKQVSFLRNRLTDLKAAQVGTFDVDDRVGTAKVYDYKQKTTSGIAVTTYNLSLYDVQLYTRLTISKTIDASYGSYTRVEGKYSGAVGYSVSTITNTTVIVLTDVTGQFQLNEPLIINGITEGNSITLIEDNTFEDIKAVHSFDGLENAPGVSTSFAANTVLSTTKKAFPESIEFNITGGNTLASPQVADFRSQLKIGDIISYGKKGTTDPTFNKVTQVLQNSVSIEAVAPVFGVCASTVTNTSGTNPLSGINVVIPTLNESDDPGFRVKLADRYISSMNVLSLIHI